MLQVNRIKLERSVVLAIFCMIMVNAQFGLLTGCSNAVMIIGRLANNWNIPIFTYAGTSEVLANKTEFRTLTRLSFSLTLCAQFYVEVFKVSPYMKEQIV